MKRNRAAVIVISLLIIFTATLAVSFCLYTPDGSNTVSNETSTEIIGSTDYGTVTKNGPLGNKSSNIRTAYIIGVHPLESNAHQLLLESIKENESNLKHCYYIYQINVTEGADDYNRGRNNGQLLAREYVVPDAASEHFHLVIDVHSNVGNWAENTFIFSPVNGSRSQAIAMEISDKLPWLTYYVPPNPTSPEYLTVPLNNMGVPAVIYETYSKDSNQTIKSHAEEFISIVDGLEDLQ